MFNYLLPEPQSMKGGIFFQVVLLSMGTDQGQTLVVSKALPYTMLWLPKQEMNEAFPLQQS